VDLDSALDVFSICAVVATALYLALVLLDRFPPFYVPGAPAPPRLSLRGIASDFVVFIFVVLYLGTAALLPLGRWETPAIIFPMFLLGGILRERREKVRRRDSSARAEQGSVTPDA
jgi:hypothetical protein